MSEIPRRQWQKSWPSIAHLLAICSSPLAVYHSIELAIVLVRACLSNLTGVSRERWLLIFCLTAMPSVLRQEVTVLTVETLPASDPVIALLAIGFRLRFPTLIRSCLSVWIATSSMKTVTSVAEKIGLSHLLGLR